MVDYSILLHAGIDPETGSAPPGKQTLCLLRWEGPRSILVSLKIKGIQAFNMFLNTSETFGYGVSQEQNVSLKCCLSVKTIPLLLDNF